MTKLTFLQSYIFALFLLASSLVNASAIWKSVAQKTEASIVTLEEQTKIQQTTLVNTTPVLTKIPNEADAFRLVMIKKDRKISRLVLANEELKTKVITLNRQVSRLSHTLKNTSKIALRKSEGSQDSSALIQKISILKTKLKRIKINDNIRCWKFKDIIKKNELDIVVNCQTL